MRDKGYDERGMDDGSYLFFVSGSPGGSKFEENSCLGKRHPNVMPNRTGGSASRGGVRVQVELLSSA